MGLGARSGPGLVNKAANIVLLLVSLLIGLGLLEAYSRRFAPISIGARNLSMSGEPVRPLRDDQLRHKAGLQYRQAAAEFDVVITIDRYGNRKSGPAGVPQVVFLGDSFTFGHGLNDDQTFAAIYCAKRRITCSNMGRSGTGTRVQLDVLEHYLTTEGWRPKEVKLFFLAMTGSLLPGNDLWDNYAYRPESVAAAADSGGGPQAQEDGISLPGVIHLKDFVLRWSNLARVVYFTVGPWIRTMLSPEPREEILRNSFRITKKYFSRLVDLATRYAFEYRIYVVHPVQDILRGTSGRTLESIKALTVPDRVVGTAQLFSGNPRDYYYPYDGHFNAVGSRKLAEFLLDE